MSAPSATLENGTQKEASGATAGIDRKKRRMEWWKKHKNQNKTNGENSEESKTEVIKETDIKTEEEKPKLRNRETIPKPDSLKYEPNYNKGFHAKILQNLFADVKKKKKKSDQASSPSKRKPESTSPSDKSKKAKTEPPAAESQTFDSYSFSLGLINGNVDISKSESSNEDKKYVLFIGNLPYDITREELEEHFRKTGGIKAIRIPKEKGSDIGKGFAYMEFDGRISHGIALRLHQTTLRGRKINVEFTSIGGNSEARRKKLKEKNRKRSNMKRR